MFEIAALFHHLYIYIYGQGKRAAISKLELFLTEWSRSYFVFALRKKLTFVLKLFSEKSRPNKAQYSESRNLLEEMVLAAALYYIKIEVRLKQITK